MTRAGRAPGHRSRRYGAAPAGRRKRAEGKKHDAALICLGRRRCDLRYAMLQRHPLPARLGNHPGPGRWGRRGQPGAGTPSRMITGNTRSVFRSYADVPSETLPYKRSRSSPEVTIALAS